MKPEDFLGRLKLYGKIDYEDEDEMLIELIGAAMDTLEAAGVSKDNKTGLYKLAVQRLALHYYENREEVGSGHPMPMGMNWMVEHLRLNTAL